MPYSVPFTAASTSSTVTPPHSPSRPPLVLSIAFASPAPVPPHTPFTPPGLATSPGIAMSTTLNFFGSSTKKMNGQPLSSAKPRPLIKALSDSSALTGSPSPSPEDSNEGLSSSRPSPIRRAASASSASPLPSAIRHANIASSGLPRIPRRRISSANSLRQEEAEQSCIQVLSTPPRGRMRSRFVIGSGEESGSGSSEERGRGREEANETNDKEIGVNVEERATRKRPISAEHSSLKSAIGASDGNASDSDASDCATPTQNRIVNGHRSHEPGYPLGASAKIGGSKGSESLESSVRDITPRARRGRGMGSARRLAFGSDSEDEVVQPKDEQSTIVFPSSNSPSPPPFIAVNAPTPVIPPYSSPPQDGSPKSFSCKRANAGSLRLDFSFGTPPADPSTSKTKNGTPVEHGRTLSESASLNSVHLIRKKSGEVVRPSLKSRSSSASSARQRPSLSLGDIASIAMGSPSVSAPTTPSTATKMVHFDKQLEHVKVFKSSSRPVAVGREGSPTYDDTTSGGEGDSASEGPSSSEVIPRPRPRRLVPGGTTGEEEEAVRRVLMMCVLNMPHREMDTDDVDVRLERLHLADDAASVQGIVRVRNIAFEKTVAVRFTFDGWQTTSEVLGRWAESCEPRSTGSSSLTPRAVTFSGSMTGVKTDESSIPTFDRFTFSIRLADLLLRIDEKTLVLAVRYCSDGREMWDNNDGQNYRAIFERRPQYSLTLAGSAVVPSGPDSTRDKGKSGEGGRKSGGAGGSSSSTSTSDGGRVSPSKFSMLSAVDKAIPGKEGTVLSPSKRGSDLASRYDLDSSLKNSSSWRPTFEQLHTWAAHEKGRDLHMSGSMPFVGDPFKARPFESHDLSFNAHGIARGSPRDLDRDTLDDSDVERFSRAHFGASEVATTPEGTSLSRFHVGPNRFVSPPSGLAFTGLEPRSRNRHRSYFDSWAMSGISTSSFGTGKARLTPPGTPRPLTYTLSDSNVDAASFIGDVHTLTPNAEEQPPTSPGRCYSFPPLMPSGCRGATMGLGLSTAHPWMGKSHSSEHAIDSEASTPSITSTSSPTTTASPSSPPEYSTLIHAVNINSNGPSDNASMSTSSYNAFVNSFCFFGSMHEHLDIATNDIRRSHSASEVQELLSTPPSSSSEAFPLLKDHAPTSDGADSRSTTPTPTVSPETLSPVVISTPPTSAGLLETESGMSTRVRC